MVFALISWRKPAQKASPTVSGLGFFEVEHERKDTDEAIRIQYWPRLSKVFSLVS